MLLLSSSRGQIELCACIRVSILPDGSHTSRLITAMKSPRRDGELSDFPGKIPGNSGRHAPRELREAPFVTPGNPTRRPDNGENSPEERANADTWGWKVENWNAKVFCLRRSCGAFF